MYISGMSNNYTIPVSNVSRVTPVNTDNSVDSASRVGKVECKTCAARKYKDGSDEADVSFQSAAHISPEASFSRVMAHEQEHVSNAREKGSKPGAKLLSAIVTLKMAVCPECGKPYVEGGTTNTMIEYSKENPYEKNRKSLEGSVLKGNNVDLSA